MGCLLFLGSSIQARLPSQLFSSAVLLCTLKCSFTTSVFGLEMHCCIAIVAFHFVFYPGMWTFCCICISSISVQIYQVILTEILWAAIFLYTLPLLHWKPKQCCQPWWVYFSGLQNMFSGNWIVLLLLHVWIGALGSTFIIQQFYFMYP